MKLLAIALAAAIIVGASAQQIPAQTARMSGWDSASAYNSLYNPLKESTVRGRIVAISHPVPEEGMSPATRLTLRLSNGASLYVDLGPSWFIQHQQRQLHIGAYVTAIGSDASIHGNPILLARKVTEGAHVLYLRDLTGYPMWVSVRPHVVVLSLAPGAGVAGPGQADSGTGVVAEAVPVPAPQPQQPTSTTGTNTSTQTTAQTMANNTGAPPGSVQGTLQRQVSVQNPTTGQVEDYLIINTPTGTMNVDIGPQWYQQQQPMTWSPGGNVLLTGITPSSPISVMPNNGNPIYFANGLTYGNQYMVLRNGPWSVWNSWY